MKQLTLLMLALLLLVSACKDDIEDPVTQPTVTDPLPKIEFNGQLFIKVLDENRAPVENATITLGNTSVETNAFGFYLFDDIKMNQNGTYFTVDKDNYFAASRRFFPRKDGEAYAVVQLLKKDNIKTFASASATTINVESGVNINFPANGIARADGTAYTGDVQVISTYLNPTQSNLGDVMPGSLLAVDAADEAAILTSFGMLGVELQSPSGEALNLASGDSATIYMQVPAELLGAAPASIPLWHFDELSGYWIEEGVAVLDGDKYVGKVGHFSFWNCDVPSNFVQLEGQVIMDGSPLVQALIKIEVAASGAAGFGWSNNTGHFGGAVPNNVPLVLSLLDDCGAVFYTQNIGPFAVDVDLGQVIIPTTSATYTHLVASVVDCDGNAIVNSVVSVEDNLGNMQLFTSDNLGVVDATVLFCTATDFDLSAIRLDSLIEGAAVNYSISPAVTTDVEVCNGTTLTEYFKITLDGEEYLLTDLMVSDDQNMLMIFDSLNIQGEFQFSLSNFMGVGTYPNSNMAMMWNNPSFTYFIECFANCGTMITTITSSSSIPGDYITGSSTGLVQVYTSTGGSTSLPMDIEFSLILD